MIIRFAPHMVSEHVQVFWSEMQRGEFITDAAAAAGTHRHRGLAWLRQSGGVRPRRGRDRKGRCLSFTEREEIALGRAWGSRCVSSRHGSLVALGEGRECLGDGDVAVLGGVLVAQRGAASGVSEPAHEPGKRGAAGLGGQDGAGVA